MAVAAVVAVVVAGTAYAGYEQHEAREEQKKANAKARRIESIRAQRERAGALRSNRLQSAQVFAAAGAGGVAGSSGVQGTLSAFGTLAAGEFSFANQIDSLNQQRLRFLDNAEGHLTRAGYGQAVASGAKTVGGAYGVGG